MLQHLVELTSVVLRTEPQLGIVYELLPEDDPTKRRADINGPRTDIDWDPETGLSSGVVDTIDYLEDRLLYSELAQ